MKSLLSALSAGFLLLANQNTIAEIHCHAIPGEPPEQCADCPKIHVDCFDEYEQRRFAGRVFKIGDNERIWPDEKDEEKKTEKMNLPEDLICKEMDTESLFARIKTHSKELTAIPKVRGASSQLLGATQAAIRSYDSDNDRRIADFCAQKLPTMVDEADHLAQSLTEGFYSVTSEKYAFSQIKAGIGKKLYDLQKYCRERKTEIIDTASSNVPTTLLQLNRLVSMVGESLSSLERNAASCKTTFSMRESVKQSPPSSAAPSTDGTAQKIR